MESRKLWGIRPGLKAVIKDLQPFVTGPHAPDRESLAVLEGLWNVDKHRRVHLADIYVALDRLDLVQRGRTIPIRVISRRTARDAEGRAELMRFQIIGPNKPDLRSEME